MTALCGACAAVLGAVRSSTTANVCSRCLVRGPAGEVLSMGECQDGCELTELEDGRFHCEDHYRFLARKETEACNMVFKRFSDKRVVRCILRAGHFPKTAHAFAPDIVQDKNVEKGRMFPVSMLECEERKFGSS